MNNNTVDLLVIGGGATGASIAYEATKRGLKVALLEAGDFGGATSSRSTKLLHGGVRYLELAFKTLDLAQLNLVREALFERAYWLKNVPFLAHRLELVLPSNNYFTQAYFGLGLKLYDLLAGENNLGESRFLSSAQIQKVLPLLSKEYNGGIAYSDGQFNDARLNILLALTAQKNGATLRSYCKVVELERDSRGKLCGAISEDRCNRIEKWKAKAIVNATGIKADQIRQMAHPELSPRILTSRGIHIVLEDNLCPEGSGLLIPSTDDGRVLFVLPFFGRTLVGTTDTTCEIEDAFSTTKEEEQYLISHINRWFPTLKDPAIKSSWAGGRPLIRSNTKAINSSRVVREHEIETLECGLVSALGGKWTTCRPIALDTLKAVEPIFNMSTNAGKELPIIGTGRNPSLTLKHLEIQKNELRKELPDSSLKDKQIEHLQSNYGLNALNIIKNAKVKKREPLSDKIPICEAEIGYSIEHECAYKPTDILARRCRLAMIDTEEAKRLLPIANKYLRESGLEEGELDLHN
ncbi:glycerol-3-phosphate dehydrogenase/oxidase [Prochlorococcus sp. MIT 1300]|uniref:glycerol-3-phosphate dehydrogenase/oxidase n=1 Tax=Prochlorococcus sp. MIT 1300 TaxID=3096218 RepID=UPI002A760960|nr:glycerol-3-phosphate dehydrogenase/oxidase [Prochlorococcus sp. MIT 1300]